MKYSALIPSYGSCVKVTVWLWVWWV